MDLQRDELKAGTGFMLSLTDAIRELSERDGYTENLSAQEDHFECQSGKFQLLAKNIQVDKMIRFENTSDPDDNAVLYAISDPTQNIKGLYVENFTSPDPLSREIIEKLKDHGNQVAH